MFRSTTPDSKLIIGLCLYTCLGKREGVRNSEVSATMKWINDVVYKIRKLNNEKLKVIYVEWLVSQYYRDHNEDLVFCMDVQTQEKLEKSGTFWPNCDQFNVLFTNAGCLFTV